MPALHQPRLQPELTPSPEGGTAEEPTIQYPPSRVEAAVDEAAGLSIPDPYRWLERDDDEVRHWQVEQNRLADETVGSWPHADVVRSLVLDLSTAQAPVVPRYAGGVWFRVDHPAGAHAPRVVSSASPLGRGDCLLDLATEQHGEAAPVVVWLSPSPDGSTLAVGVCTDGSERNTMRLVDVRSASLRSDPPPQVLNDGWTGGAAWLRDSSGFYFTGLTAHEDAFRQQVYFHRLGDPPPQAPVALDLPNPSEGTVVQLSRDGRWAVAAHGIGMTAPVAVRDLADPAGDWGPYVMNVDGTVAGHPVDTGYVAVTDVDAPRGRLVRIPFDSVAPNDPATWHVLVPESDAVLRGVSVVGDTLYLWELVGTYSQVRITTHDGHPLGVVPLPGRGTVHEPVFPLMGLIPRGHEDEYLFVFSTPVTSPGLYRHRPGDAQCEVLLPPDRVLDAVVEDGTARSADGTLVPFHLVRPKDQPSGPSPTLLYAYGGFGMPLLPQWPQSTVAFVAAGGTRVVAHIRGGGELGRAWWHGGRLAHKTKGYDDLYAVAEELIGRGLTSSSQLAVQGGSNGGLMAAVALAQRPELWGAVVSQVPLTDLVGALREPYTRFVVEFEMGDPESADDVRRLLTYSPYHLVRDGVHYPATYIEAGATDPRCPPWHARKLAARLQAAQAGPAPVLLRVWDGSGHGLATSPDALLGQQLQSLCFAMQATGLTPRGSAVPV